jgi:hypothetical protein
MVNEFFSAIQFQKPCLVIAIELLYPVRIVAIAEAGTSCGRSSLTCSGEMRVIAASCGQECLIKRYGLLPHSLEHCPGQTIRRSAQDDPVWGFVREHRTFKHGTWREERNQRTFVRTCTGRTKGTK